ATTQTRLEEASKRVAELQGQLAERTGERAALAADLSAAQQARVRLAAELDAERKASAEKLALLQQAEAKLRDAFASLSSEALRQNNQSFLELARASLSEFQQSARQDLDGRAKAIEDLVPPLRDSLTHVDSKLQQVEQSRIGSQSALTEQLRALHQSQQLLQTETGRLVQALRSPN